MTAPSKNVNRPIAVVHNIAMVQIEVKVQIELNLEIGLKERES